ncbi:MAG: DUF4381 domain-containing protein [Gammaproteobacteria bacterium AqS3]|nr:DUF4381 domain-containing protein [Gammaproteobacteria bacterium AqS3]
MNDLLSQMRDIHTPAAPGFWPPSLLIVMLTLAGIALCAAAVWGLHHHYAERWRRIALGELESIRTRFARPEDFALAAKACNLLLKRSCALIYGTGAAARSGEDWLRVLDRIHGSDIPSRELSHLLETPYAHVRAVEAQNPEPMFQYCDELIRSMRRGQQYD